jgi:hypothetical protein
MFLGGHIVRWCQELWQFGAFTQRTGRVYLHVLAEMEAEDCLDLPVTISAFSSGVNCATKAFAFSKAASHPPAPVMFATRNCQWFADA